MVDSTDKSTEESKIKDILIDSDIISCVCSKVSGKNLITGWRPSAEKKGMKKRCEASRGDSRSYASLRRERTTLPPTDGFVFRHYERTESYIEQYRENHSSAAVVIEFEEKPTLGVDAPDPYLPKITTKSKHTERMRLFETLAEYYRIVTTESSGMKDICLTGKRSDPHSDRRTFPNIPHSSSDDSSPSNSSTKSLPKIDQHRNLTLQGGLSCEISNLATVREVEESHKDKHEREKRAKTEALTIASTRTSKVIDKVTEIIGCKPANKYDTGRRTVDNTKSRREKLRERSESKEDDNQFCDSSKAKAECDTLPRVRLWTENKREKRENVLETLRIGGKRSDGKDSSEEDSGENQKNNLTTPSFVVPPSSRGNLRLGTTVKASPKSSSQVSVGMNRCEVYSTRSPLELLHNVTKKRKSTSGAAYIKILGQATGPPSKPKTATEKKSCPSISRSNHDASPRDYRMPTHYMRRFGGQFHHVLEARSYKPEHRGMGATIMPN
ncbi:uncharacterized protein LOC116618636 [Nematostella vectensis]|uniref:uncharacterized protein LOC116618636 n=1 Tax=Nematostella vectensis TaxID=45351 RepID=UPI002076ED74|nr:uncharacterized protein LOC116618636 [Nematostella vectensis]